MKDNKKFERPCGSPELLTGPSVYVMTKVFEMIYDEQHFRYVHPHNFLSLISRISTAFQEGGYSHDDTVKYLDDRLRVRAAHDPENNMIGVGHHMPLDYYADDLSAFVGIYSHYESLFDCETRKMDNADVDMLRILQKEIPQNGIPISVYIELSQCDAQLEDFQLYVESMSDTYGEDFKDMYLDKECCICRKEASIVTGKEMECECRWMGYYPAAAFMDERHAPVEKCLGHDYKENKIPF